MADEDEWNGITRSDFRNAIARNLDGFQETIMRTNTMIGAELDTQSKLLPALKSQKSTVQKANLVFDVIGFAGGIGGAGKVTAKAFFKHVAKTASEKIAMNFANELSRANFKAETGADQASADQAAAGRDNKKMTFAVYGFVQSPLHARQLARALEGGPYQLHALSRHLTEKNFKLEELGKAMASDAWDQMHHGSSLVVPKAGITYNKMVDFCKSVIFQSLFMELNLENLKKYQVLLSSLSDATYKSGESIYGDLQSNGLLKVSPNASVADLRRQAELWTQGLTALQNANPFEGLFKM